jgi:4-hydroxy-tetrahydrodipicolinate synthase
MKLAKGTGVAMVTPLTTTGEVDVPGLKKLTRHLVDGKIEILVVLGSTGEAATLTEAQKIVTVETVMDENNGVAQVMVGCGGNDTRKVATEIADYSKRFAPDSFLSVSPAYNKPSQEGIFRHFQAVCAATDRTVVLYNVPGRTSSNVMPETVLRIAQECPNMQGIKEASGNVEQIMELIRRRPDGFTVYSGDDMLALGLIACGADGVISVLGNAVPLAFSELIRTALRGNFEKARNDFYPLMRLTQLLFVEGNPAGIKGALAELGITDATVNLPLVEASVALRTDIKKELTRIG